MQFPLQSHSCDSLRFGGVIVAAGLLPVVLSALTHEYMEPQMVNKMVKDHGYFKTVSGGGGSGGCPLQAFESLSNKNLAASALGALISHLVRLKVRSMSIVRCSSLV